MWKSEFRQNYYRTPFSPTVPHFAARISRVVADGGTWRLKWERLKAGESNGKLPPRTCSGCSVPEPYRSHDWALVPAKPGLQGWILMNEWMNHRWKSKCVQCAWYYRGADKALDRPGRKQARKHVRDARDFNNIETRAVIKFSFFSCKARRRRKFTPFWQKR